MTLVQLAQEKRDDIIKIAAKRGASNPRILDPDAKKDIDLLFDLEPDRTLFDLGWLLADLEDLLDPIGDRDSETYSLAIPKVSIATESGLRFGMRDKALAEKLVKEAIPL